jgi:branched-subunit amino acid aminotransferase/4-amino-4-deoxychorismate lyase
MSGDGLLAVAVSGRGLVAPGEPVIAADDEGFTRGRAAFETMRVYGGRPFRFAEHVARLRSSAERIGLEPPDGAEIEHLTALALEKAGAPEAVLRLYWTPGPPNGDHCAVVLVGPIPGWIEEARARGQRLVSLLHQRRSAPWLLPATKSTSYAVSIAAEAEAKARGADDAIFVDGYGIVLEGPVTNIWWREGDVLLTPSLEVGILAGETRAALLELAARSGQAVEEGIFPLARLLAADEVFTSSSIRELMPVISVDGHPFARGPAAAALQQALRDEARLGGAESTA